LTVQTIYGDSASWMQLQEQYHVFILAKDSTGIYNFE